ncbi:CopG family transcriptional regulator [Lacticaseibacillus absianus]|uniref:CopG family transcriptional regulator n=1 Tax=Lacticaseibacillus absianus TaxID=2729623 RepID=UPI0015CB1A1A|nr:CopG family transcriptional regulator [Lacticaseibacillus absianus]
MRDTQTEKLTFNFTSADLAAIDLLVANGFYRNRTDFVLQAVHSKLDASQDYLTPLLAKEQTDDFTLGLMVLTTKTLQALHAANKVQTIKVYGMLIIEQDVPLDLLQATVATIKVYGVCSASRPIKAAYGL